MMYLIWQIQFINEKKETKCFFVHCTASFTLGQGTIYSNKFQMILHEEIQRLFALSFPAVSRTNMHRRHNGWSPSPSMRVYLTVRHT
jgi:hypothetical protein